MAAGVRRTGPRVPGVVLRVTGRSAVVLADGQFLRLRAVPGWMPGLEVWVRPPAPASLGARVRRIGAAIAVGGAAIAAGGALASAVVSAQAAAVVSIDINPSVQMDVNARGRVIQVQGLDADGQRLVAAGGLRHLPVDQAISLVVQRAVADGYLGATAATTPPATSSTASSSTAAGSAPSSGANPTGGAQPAPGSTTPSGAGPSAGAHASVVLVAVAPVGLGRHSLPPAVVSEVNTGRARATGLLSKERVSAPVDVAQGHAGQAHVAKQNGVSLGEQIVADSFSQAGAAATPSEFTDQALGQALASRLHVPPDDDAAVMAAVSSGSAQAVDAVLPAAMHGATPAQLEALLKTVPPASSPKPGAARGASGRGHRSQSGTGSAAEGRSSTGHGAEGTGQKALPTDASAGGQGSQEGGSSSVPARAPTPSETGRQTTPLPAWVGSLQRLLGGVRANTPRAGGQGHAQAQRPVSTGDNSGGDGHGTGKTSNGNNGSNKHDHGGGSGGGSGGVNVGGDVQGGGGSAGDNFTAQPASPNPVADASSGGGGRVQPQSQAGALPGGAAPRGAGGWQSASLTLTVVPLAAETTGGRNARPRGPGQRPSASVPTARAVTAGEHAGAGGAAGRVDARPGGPSAPSGAGQADPLRTSAVRTGDGGAAAQGPALSLPIPFAPMESSGSRGRGGAAVQVAWPARAAGHSRSAGAPTLIDCGAARTGGGSGCPAPHVGAPNGGAQGAPAPYGTHR